MSRFKTHSILFEQLKSFTTLARTLNLSKAVRELGSTRQTLRRHISMIEECMGAPLFSIEDRQYALTETGRHSLREAENLLAHGEAWLYGVSGHVDGLQHIIEESDPEYSYYMQQHPIGALWQGSSLLMQEGLRCWAKSKGQLEDPTMAPIRPYFMVYRWFEGNWVCVEVGNKSSYASWFGWEWQRSSIGRGVADLPGGPGFGNLLTEPFHEVSTTQSVRLDHIHTQISRSDSGPKVPVSYQRLLLGCKFPDNTIAIVALTDRTHNIEIQGLSQEKAMSMPSNLIMEYEPDQTKMIAEVVN